MSINPKDPLLASGPEQQRVLFDRYREASRDFPVDAVMGAAINLVVTALRQSRPSRQLAEQGFNEYAQKTLALLLEHYDSVTGKRKNIFPFTQVIQMGLHEEPDRINWDVRKRQN